MRLMIMIMIIMIMIMMIMTMIIMIRMITIISSSTGEACHREFDRGIERLEVRQESVK